MAYNDALPFPSGIHARESVQYIVPYLKVLYKDWLTVDVIGFRK